MNCSGEVNERKSIIPLNIFQNWCATVNFGCVPDHYHFYYLYDKLHCVFAATKSLTKSVPRRRKSHSGVLDETSKHEQLSNPTALPFQELAAPPDRILSSSPSTPCSQIMLLTMKLHCQLPEATSNQ